MQFKHPEILYALFLLLIPIIVHLFQLRKFEKVPFTNVQFLKKIELETRKSSKLKKILILLSRLFLFAALIFAFAQPYFSKVSKNAEQATYIYLDNSLSMQAKNSQGELFKRAIQDIIENNQSDKNIHLFTNDNQWKDLTSQDLKNILLSLDYSPVKQNLKSIDFKFKNQIKSNDKILNNIVLISDFQSNENNIDVIKDSVTLYNFIQLKPSKTSNISLDSIYISNQNNETITLKVVVRSHNRKVNKVPVSLYNDNVIIGKSAVDILKNDTAEVTFTIPYTSSINGKVISTDDNLIFDNELYFSINQTEKINVLAIGENTTYLSRIYTSDEYKFISNKVNELDYGSLTNQNLIILNEIENIPTSLVSSLAEAVKKGSNLVIVPSTDSNISSYNALLKTLNIGSVNSKNNSELTITDINFVHPFLQNVFEKQIKNFQYPKVNSYYTSNLRNSSPILKFENGTTFVSQIKTNNSTIYWLAAAINNKNSNFKNSPLIVPIFYNFGKYSYKKSQLNYTIGNTNEIEIKAVLQKDDILQITNASESFIPLQQVGNTSVKITTTDKPLKSGIYTINKKEDQLKNIAFNYNRNEGVLEYIDIENSIKNKPNFKYFTNTKEAFTTINNEYKTSSFWQLFLILALVFMLVEVLLIKFFKS